MTAQPARSHPSSSDKAEALVGRLMEYVQAIASPSPQDANALAGAYLQALRQIPEPLQPLAVRRVVTGHTYGKAPKPGDLTSAIRDEWQAEIDRKWEERAASQKRIAPPSDGIPGKTHLQSVDLAKRVLAGDRSVNGVKTGQLLAAGYLRHGESGWEAGERF